MKTYIAHLIRSKHESCALENTTKNLTPTECIIVFDYKMKLLTMYYHESQAQFFGKRGTSWLGCMFVRKKTQAELDSDKTSSANYVTNYYDILCDDSKENGESVVNALHGVLLEYKQTPAHAHITSCTLFSDGAGCFSGTDLFVCLPYMGIWTGK